MNTFLKNSLRTLGLLLIINLAACSSSDNDYNDNAPNEGGWRGSLTYNDVGAAGAVADEDDSIEVDVVFADGRVMIIPDEEPDEEPAGKDDDLYMYSGTYKYSDSDGEIGGDALEYGEVEFGDGCSDFNCEATGANMSFRGTVDDSGTMNLKFDLLDEFDDKITTGTIQLDYFDDGEGSAIDDIKGDWVTGDDDLAITVYKDGSFFGGFTYDDCNIEGEISILDPEYYLYDATSTIVTCDPVTGDYIGFAEVEYGDVPYDDMLTIIGSNKDYIFFADLFRD